MSLSRIDEAPLSVLLDIRHPFAYLALGPAAALAQELGIDLALLLSVASNAG